MHIGSSPNKPKPPKKKKGVDPTTSSTKRAKTTSKPYRKTFKSNSKKEILEYLNIHRNTTVIFSDITPCEIDSEGFVIKESKDCFAFVAQNKNADIPFAFIKIKHQYLKKVKQEFHQALKNLEEGQTMEVCPYGYGVDFIVVAMKHHQGAHIRGKFPRGRQYWAIRRTLEQHQIWCQLSFGKKAFRIKSLPWVTEIN